MVSCLHDVFSKQFNFEAYGIELLVLLAKVKFRCLWLDCYSLKTNSSGL
jgi:hypothetical protein